MPQVWFVTGSSRGLGRAIAETALAGGDPPRSVVPGTDAYEVAEAAQRALAGSDTRHRDLAVSIAYDA